MLLRSVSSSAKHFNASLDEITFLVNEVVLSLVAILGELRVSTLLVERCIIIYLKGTRNYYDGKLGQLTTVGLSTQKPFTGGNTGNVSRLRRGQLICSQDG